MDVTLPILPTLLAHLRAAVGYLGERDQHGWWQSRFLSAGSTPFLTPVFGRTLLLARCAGTTQAAALLHDERIGVGRVFHLFRLPEDLEQAVHHAVRDLTVAPQIAALIASPDAALAYLQGVAYRTVGSGIGPTQVGAVPTLREHPPWRTVAAQYAHAFRTQTQVYPYFTERV